ncbi:hypothetical protein KAJ27_15190 [bacterium]|nr:hypothetical protein [bacterium]
MKKITLFLLLFSILFSPAQLMSQCPGTSMAGSARNGAISWGAGLALGMAKEQLFPGSGAATKKDIQELKRKLDEIQNQLNNLSKQVAYGNHELKKEIRKSAFNIGSMNLQTYLRIVTKAYSDLHVEIRNHHKGLSKEALKRSKTTINSILDTIQHHIEPQIGALHKSVYGGGFDDGLYKMYADKLLATRRFINNENYRKEVIAFVKYYNQIQALETYLVLTLYKIRNFSHTQYTRRINELDKNSKKEWAWLAKTRSVPINSVIFYARKLMFYMRRDNYQHQTMDYIGASYWPRDHMNKRRINGFNNWRLPLKGEVDAIFYHWVGKPGTFALHQGFENMSVSRYIGWGPAKPIRNIELAKKFPGHTISVSGWGAYDTTSGSSGAMGKGFHNKFQCIPVRTIPNNEIKKYIW